MVDLTAAIPPPVSGHLKVGGSNPQGVEINANSRYLTLGGKPWFPVMGEFHYARYPHAEWERELLKMKAGGINIVSVYIFWIHHEEIEGQFDWSGDRDLRQFVQLCAKHGLYVWLRIGPWDHGEARSGGLPDWLVAKFPDPRRMRTTDPEFMGYVRTLYTQIFQQVQGLLYKDGGPIVGVQVENELRNDPNYLLALKNMAREIGFDVPLYSMTGWGPARVPPNELLPMFGGYGDGFWLSGSGVTGQVRVQYFFTHNPNDERVQLTSAPGNAPASMRYLTNYPYLTCEIGGGMAIAYARRPLMTWQDVAAVALCKLGNGSCLMGYYMYHGGGNPEGKLTTLQESELTSYTNDNDLPLIDYDFQAPLGQFGQVRPIYHALRMLHMFLADFGGDLCDMPATLPAVLPKNLNDETTLRWEARSDGQRGFIFINNHERGVALPPKEAQFDLRLPGGDQIVPAEPARIPTDGFMIWPFNLDMNGIALRYATAQLLCKVDGALPTYVFFAPDGVKPQFAFDAAGLASVDGASPPDRRHPGLAILHDLEPGVECQFTVHSIDGNSVKVILLTQEQAMHSWKTIVRGSPRLIVMDGGGDLYWDDNSLTVEHTIPAHVELVYPPMDSALSFAAQETHPIAVQVQQIKPAGPPRTIPLSARRKPLPPTDADFDAAAVWHITIPADAFAGVADVRLKIDYAGDAARAYIGDKLIDDDFFYGRPWELGLNRYAPDVLTKGITIKILPLTAANPAYIQPEVRPRPDGGGAALGLRGVEAVGVYESSIPAQ